MKWNDFEANASKSFTILRKEEDFSDVTLVSDDEKHISAHKLVLSASSEFFNLILKKVKHSNPLIYLNGIKSKELSFILDYIYEGEVQIYQEEMDNFLEVAQKLKIEGLIVGRTEAEEYVKKEENILIETAYNQNHNAIPNFNEPKENQSKVLERSLSVVGQNTSREEAAKAVDELIVKNNDGIWECKACGKTTKQKSNSQIRLHAESHIEGLSFPCLQCNRSFRSRYSLAQHKHRT